MDNLSERRAQTVALHRPSEMGRRLSGAFALGVVLSLAFAPVASAQVSVVKDATKKVADTATETGGKVGHLVADTGSTVGDSVGGPLGGIVKNTTGQAGDTITGTSATAGDTLRSVGEAADQTIEATLDAVNGVTGGATNPQTDGDGKRNENKNAPPTLSEKRATSTSGTRTPFPLVGSDAQYSAGASEAPALAAGWTMDARTPAELFQAAVEAAKRFAFPLALTLLVIVFLVIQNRIDNKDPKLAVAPLDMDGELLSFS